MEPSHPVFHQIVQQYLGSCDSAWEEGRSWGTVNVCKSYISRSESFFILIIYLFIWLLSCCANLIFWILNCSFCFNLSQQNTCGILYLRSTLYDNRPYFYLFLFLIQFPCILHVIKKCLNLFWKTQKLAIQRLICKCVKMGCKCCFGNVACAHLKIAWIWYNEIIFVTFLYLF